MRWLLCMVALTACRTLAPPPEDIDAYCVGVLRRSGGIVPPECADTAARIFEGRHSPPREVSREEELAELERHNPMAACMERAADRAKRCKMSVAFSGVGSDTLEAFTGVGPKTSTADLNRECTQQMAVEFELCRARHSGGGR
jgi:hypothetical protein